MQKKKRKKTDLISLKNDADKLEMDDLERTYRDLNILKSDVNKLDKDKLEQVLLG